MSKATYDLFKDRLHDRYFRVARRTIDMPGLESQREWVLVAVEPEYRRMRWDSEIIPLLNYDRTRAETESYVMNHLKWLQLHSSHLI